MAVAAAEAAARAKEVLMVALVEAAPKAVAAGVAMREAQTEAVVRAEASGGIAARGTSRCAMSD